VKFFIERKMAEQLAAAFASDDSLSIATMPDREVFLDFSDPQVEHHLRVAARELSQLYQCGYEHKDLGDGWLGIRLNTSASHVLKVVRQKGGI